MWVPSTHSSISLQPEVPEFAKPAGQSAHVNDPAGEFWHTLRACAQRTPQEPSLVSEARSAVMSINVREVGSGARKVDRFWRETAVLSLTCARLRGSNFSLERIVGLMCAMTQTLERATATRSGGGSTVSFQWVGKYVTSAVVDITLVVVAALRGSIVLPASRAVGARERRSREILADS